jgi:uncharacterized membrane protein YoaK (UPF0700 family)
MKEYHYAGWIVFDLKLLVFITVLCLLLSVAVISIFFRERKWHEHLTFFFAVFIIAFAVSVVIFNTLAHYPVFRIETIFPFP